MSQCLRELATSESDHPQLLVIPFPGLWMLGVPPLYSVGTYTQNMYIPAHINTEVKIT